MDGLCISLMCYRVIKDRINLVYLFTSRGNLLLLWVSGLLLARLQSCAPPARQLLRVAAAHFRGRTCSAFTERVPKLGRGAGGRKLQGEGGRGQTYMEKRKGKLEESSAEERHEGLAGKQKMRSNGKVAV